MSHSTRSAAFSNSARISPFPAWRPRFFLWRQLAALILKTHYLRHCDTPILDRHWGDFQQVMAPAAIVETPLLDSLTFDRAFFFSFLAYPSSSRKSASESSVPMTGSCPSARWLSFLIPAAALLPSIPVPVQTPPATEVLLTDGQLYVLFHADPGRRSLYLSRLLFSCGEERPRHVFPRCFLQV